MQKIAWITPSGCQFFDPSALLGMFVILIPLILLVLLIYFLVRIKRGLDDLSMEMRDTREMIRVSIHRPMPAVPDRSNWRPSSGETS